MLKSSDMYDWTRKNTHTSLDATVQICSEADTDESPPRANASPSKSDDGMESLDNGIGPTTSEPPRTFIPLGTTSRIGRHHPKPFGKTIYIYNQRHRRILSSLRVGGEPRATHTLDLADREGGVRVRVRVYNTYSSVSYPQKAEIWSNSRARGCSRARARSAAQRTFDAGQVSQMIKGSLRRVLGVVRQPLYQPVHGHSRGLTVLLASLCLSERKEERSTKQKQRHARTRWGVRIYVYFYSIVYFIGVGEAADGAANAIGGLSRYGKGT